MKAKFTLLALYVFALSASSEAQTPLEYYVDISQTTNGNGTAGSPWNRIWYAVNRSPRDTTKDAIVYIKGGTYVIDSTQYLTQLYIGADHGGANGKYLTLKPYPGDEGKVIIDGKNLANTSMFVISGAKYIKLQNLVFRNLKNTSGYVLNIQNAQNIQVSNCAFDSLYWTTTSAEYGYPTVNGLSNFIDPVYLSGNSNVTLSQDTLKNAAIGWGDFIRDGGGNSSVTTTSLITSNTTPVASDYYVALNGHDTTGSGSIAKPWRTIKRSVDLAGINYTVFPSKLIDAPVTIHLRAGTHKPAVNGIFINTNRGVNGQWFTIRNYPGETAIVDGTDITEKFSALFSIAGAKFVKIEGLKLTKMTDDSTLTNSAPAAGIKDTRFGIIVSGKAANIIIKKNELYDMAWTRDLNKQKTPGPTDNLNPLVILGTTDTAIRNVIIDSNLVYNNVPGFSEAVTINGNVDSFAVTNNIVHDNGNIGIVAAGHYQWVVDDAAFTVTAPNNYSRNGYIKSNTVYQNLSPYAISAGIYLDGSSNVTVEDNESYRNGVGLSIGNEQYNSTSGGHLVQSNVFRDNLGAGIYYGSTNPTSMVQNCVVKWNTLRDNYILDSALRAKANNQYGITNASQRYTELNVYRLQNSTFEENTIESLSDIVVGFYLAQSGLTFRYNEYYVISENACQATFVQDKNNDGGISLPPDSIYTNFHQYANRTGYDQNSECEGQAYSSSGCGLGLRGVNYATATSKPVERLTAKLVAISAYPNPVVGSLSVRLGMKGNGTVSLGLYNISGQLVLQQQRQLTEGNHELGWNDIKQKALPGGVYLLKVSTPFETKNIKVLIQ